MNVGDYFRIAGQKHWANGQVHRAAKIQRETVTGNPDVPALDLGTMVTFQITDWHGEPCSHAVPIEWCVPCERPSVAKRVKSAVFDEGAKPEFWDSLYSACRSAK